MATPLRPILPDPVGSLIERCCRQAGQEPKSDANRKYWDRRIGRLFRSDISQTDVSAVADYLRGRFDRQPEQGRRVNLWDRYSRYITIEIVRNIRRELGCTIKTAIRISLERASIADPDGQIAKSIWHDWRR